MVHTVGEGLTDAVKEKIGEIVAYSKDTLAAGDCETVKVLLVEVQAVADDEGV